jgi:polygalacturonase
MNDHPMGVGAQFLSRRKWLTSISTPALAAALLPKSASAAEPARAAQRDAGTRTYNIRDFGAKGDGKTLDTAALQAAIEDCNRDGGGTVLVPSGTFVIGTTELKSNVTLHLAASAILLGSGDGKDYHPISAIPLSGDSTLNDGNWALLFAVEARNVTVEGAGTIDGQGQLFNNFGHKETPPPAGISGPQRPYHLLFHRCHNMTLENLSFSNLILQDVTGPISINFSGG